MREQRDRKERENYGKRTWEERENGRNVEIEKSGRKEKRKGKEN